MGVPNFYTWLKKRYPLAVYNIGYQHGHQTDFFYMDMNQVIYKCALQQTSLFKDQICQRSFTEVWVAIFNYIDRIVSLVKPSRVLFLTFDGVAPRAKMNQQRQRRFQSAQRATNIEKILISLGEMERNETFKNNQISPGTEFMHELNRQLQFFIERKIHEDPNWQGLKVVFSGSDVPGEGEHKILEFIRNTMAEPTYDPQWTHMIYGADADLIMLGLLTRIKYMSIVREIMKFSHATLTAVNRDPIEPEFELININIVREYIDKEYNHLAEGMKYEYNIDRIIDDFIMICFFVGNDFLPRVFCFDIRQGTLENLIKLFKEHLTDSEDYLNFRGQINWVEFKRLMGKLSEFETVALADREEEIIQYFQDKEFSHNDNTYDSLINKELTLISKLKELHKQDKGIDAREYFYQSKSDLNLGKDQDLEKLEKQILSYIEGIQFVLLYYYQGVPSWRWFYPAYYAPLCGDLYLALAHYIELGQPPVSNPFPKDDPFPPFKQLISILSPANAVLLPEQYRPLLTSANSQLRHPFDYYPDRFDVDPYGTIYEHQFIAKIPFVPEKLIDSVYESIDLNGSAADRNKRGVSYLFEYNVSTSQKIKSTITDVYSDFFSNQTKSPLLIEDKQQCGQIIASIAPAMKPKDKALIPSILTVDSEYNLTQIKERFLLINRLCIKHTSDTKMVFDRINESRKQKQRLFTYVGFPVPYFCEIMGIINLDELRLTFDYQALELQHLEDLQYTKQTHVQVFNSLSERLKITLTESGIVNQITNILIVNVYTQLLPINDKERFFRGRSGRSVLVLPEWVYWDSPVDLNGLERYLTLATQQPRLAVLLHGVGDIPKGSLLHVKNLRDKEADVELIRKTKKQVFVSKPKKNEETFSVGFVADICKVSEQVLLYIMGSVIIFLDQNQDSFKDLVPSLDIGLNIISREKNKLVPELVRINKADQSVEGYDKYKQFLNLQLTKECVEIIAEYRSRCLWLFMYLEKIYQERTLKNPPRLSVNIAFQKEKDPNIGAINLYIWISKQPFSQYRMGSAASQVLTGKSIKKLEKDKRNLKQGKEKKEITKEKRKNPTITVSLYHLSFESPCIFVPPLYKDHPPIHRLYDRVVSLDSSTIGMPQFGTQGTVVGIQDRDNQIMVEVLWDEPQIGLSSLGQRIGLLKGQVCSFVGVYNVTQDWEKLLVMSDAETSGKIWDYRTKYYIPTFSHAENKIRSNELEISIKKMAQLNEQTEEERKQFLAEREQKKNVIVKKPLEEHQTQVQYPTLQNPLDALKQLNIGITIGDGNATEDKGALTLEEVEAQIMRTSSVPNNTEPQCEVAPIQKSYTSEPKKVLQKAKYVEKTNEQSLFVEKNAPLEQPKQQEQKPTPKYVPKQDPAPSDQLDMLFQMSSIIPGVSSNTQDLNAKSLDEVESVFEKKPPVVKVLQKQKPSGDT